jgi:MFS family permease
MGGAGVLAFIFFRALPQLSVPHPEVHVETAEHVVVSVGHHAALLSITFVQNLGVTLIASYMFRYTTDPVALGGLGFSLNDLGWLVGAPVVGVGLLALPLSRLADSLGKIRAVRLAFTVAAVALWAFSRFQSLPALAITATCLAVAFSIGIPAWLAIISSLATANTRGLTLAGYGTVQGAAAAIGPLIGGVIWDKIGHAQIFTASALTLTLAAILTWVTLPEHAPHSKNLPSRV